MEIKIPSDAQMMPFASHLLTYSKDGISCMDTKGNAVWNQTFEMQNPMVDINQNVVAVGDYNGREIYVMNTDSVLGSITTNRPVRDFCVSAGGVVAAVLDDTDVTLICLYDANGKELVRFRTTMKRKRLSCGGIYFTKRRAGMCFLSVCGRWAYEVQCGLL